MTHRVLILLAVGALAAPSHAERYRVVLGRLPPILVDDARTYATRRDPDPQPAASPQPVPSPSVRAVPPAVPIPPERRPASVTPPRPPVPPVSAIDPRVAMTPSQAGPPTDAFKTALTASFGVQSPDEVRQMWVLYSDEPASLSDKARMGNAVVRWMLATGRAPTGMDSARPDLLNPEATRGTVRAVGGIPLRATPWGEATGGEYPQGTVLEIRAPAHGAWYRVTGPGAAGWLPGVWIDLK